MTGPQDEMAAAEVGLELTFHNPDTAAKVTNGGLLDPAWWTRVRKNWAERVETNSPVAGGVSVSEVAQKVFGGRHSGHDITGSKFTYTPTEATAAQDEGFNGWWWTLTVDPGVIEIQTVKTPGRSFQNNETVIGQIIEEDIFEVARNLGFQPGGGGGHINVDSASGFRGDDSLVPHVVWGTEVVVNGLRGGKDREPRKHALIDWENEGRDPFVGTGRANLGVTKAPSRSGSRWTWTREGKETKDRSASWRSDVLDRGAAGFREAHAEWLFGHPSTAQILSVGTPNEQFPDQGDSAELVGSVLHYQAVNIDHLRDEDAKSRRLEFRFFKGQEDLAQIYDGIVLIGEIKQAARESRRA